MDDNEAMDDLDQGEGNSDSGVPTHDGHSGDVAVPSQGVKRHGDSELGDLEEQLPRPHPHVHSPPRRVSKRPQSPLEGSDEDKRGRVVATALHEPELPPIKELVAMSNQVNDYEEGGIDPAKLYEAKIKALDKSMPI